MKVATIVGTRPELIKLSRVIAEVDRTAKHVLIHTGQNYDHELNQIFFKDLDIRNPNHFLGVAGSTLGETIGNAIARSYGVLQQERPDALLLLGDTNSCLSAIAAKRLKIPIFHMEAGAEPQNRRPYERHQSGLHGARSAASSDRGNSRGNDNQDRLADA